MLNMTKRSGNAAAQLTDHAMLLNCTLLPSPDAEPDSA